MPDATTTPVNAPESPANWFSVAAFALARGVSIRTVKRWIENGEVTTKKDGARRLVWLEKEGHSRDIRGTQERDIRDTEEGHEGTQAPLSLSEVGTQQGHKGTRLVSLPSERENELKDEIRFLRGIVESDRRDMGELRAALREALKMAPKMLTAGESSTSVSGAKSDAKSDARIEESDVQNHATGKVNGAANGARIEATSTQAVTFDSIADWLEAQGEVS
jgi:hypothetical protein